MLIQGGPVVDRRAAIEQLLVAVDFDALGHGNSELIDVREDHRAHAVHAFEDIRELLAKAPIGNNDLNFRMVDDVPNLIIHQLLVQRGKDRAFAGGAKEDLEVLRTIP